MIDAKNYRGRLEVSLRGSFFHPDDRLFVGRRDRSRDADGVLDQVDLIRSAIRDVDLDPPIPVTGVLCFLNVEWPLLFKPASFRGVRLESSRSVKTMIGAAGGLDLPWIEHLRQVLGTTFRSR